MLFKRSRRMETTATKLLTGSKGEIIPGLFAAGEVANGDFFNEEYPAWGRSIQMSLTFGRGGFFTVMSHRCCHPPQISV